MKAQKEKQLKQLEREKWLLTNFSTSRYSERQIMQLDRINEKIEKLKQELNQLADVGNKVYKTNNN